MAAIVMTFDVDFYPEGLSEKFPFDLKGAGPLKNVTLQGLQLIVKEIALRPAAIRKVTSKAPTKAARKRPARHRLCCHRARQQ